MRIVIARVGRGGLSWADEACRDYGERVDRKLSLEEWTLPTSDPEDESARLLAKLKGGDLLIALDERGEALDSDRFAALLNDGARRGAKRLVFAIGGPHGHAQAVRDTAARVVRLSDLVLNHEVARVVLHEQLYRATTILWGGAYHHR